MNKVGIGVLGAGTVGGTLIRRMIEDRAGILAKSGLDLEVRRVAVRDVSKTREFTLPSGLLTDDPLEVIDDPQVGLVVEVMGGEDPAGDLVLRALEAGKPVVTANKALIAARGPELITAAEKHAVPLLFEAAVGGAIPIIRPLTESLAGEPITRVLGIVNGTTNFILTQMADGADYESALAEAQALGYAEPDPAADVSGADAAAKASILASLAFGMWVGLDRVYYEGIEKLSPTDFRFAADLGYVVKLLAVADRSDEGVSARVHPVMLPHDHPLASIRAPRMRSSWRARRSTSCSSQGQAPGESRRRPLCSETSSMRHGRSSLVPWRHRGFGWRLATCGTSARCLPSGT